MTAFDMGMAVALFLLLAGFVAGVRFGWFKE